METRVEGYMQPGRIYCPEGHQMLMMQDDPSVKNTVDKMRAVCCEKECAHYHIKYKVVMPKILLEKIESNGG
jgi:hypothetical protein